MWFRGGLLISCCSFIFDCVWGLSEFEQAEALVVVSGGEVCSVFF